MRVLVLSPVPVLSCISFWHSLARLVFVTDKELERCSDLLVRYKAGILPPGVTDDDLWYAKKGESPALVEVVTRGACIAPPPAPLPLSVAHLPHVCTISDGVCARLCACVCACARGPAPIPTVREAIVHPTIGEKIALPWRMSFFVPANVPICAGMVLTSSVRRHLHCVCLFASVCVCVSNPSLRAAFFLCVLGVRM